MQLIEIECLLVAYALETGVGRLEASTYLEELTARIKLERVKACGISTVRHVWGISARHWLASRLLRLEPREGISAGVKTTAFRERRHHHGPGMPQEVGQT